MAQAQTKPAYVSPLVLSSVPKHKSPLNGFMGYYLSYDNDSENCSEVQRNAMNVARYLAEEIKEMGIFDVFEDASEFPIICWSLKDSAHRQWTLEDLDDSLLIRGWATPFYQLVERKNNPTCQRIICIADLSLSMAMHFIEDMRAEIKRLDHATVIGGSVGYFAKQAA